MRLISAAFLGFCVVFSAFVAGFTPNEGLDGEKQISFNRPEGIAFNRQDHLFVADSGNDRIVEFDGQLGLVKTVGTKKQRGSFASLRILLSIRQEGW